ncbi:ammonia-forming cytochrome c nitrite reductase subunit c552 [Glaciecola sp. 2405UD65-10]|uniref:ammonia-forming cytochrome c nitrite reductase subunit c552 n=1 Tax=Glaciecola sp. 2405UD65-10 TaxID=3397244 RepID=UPI003B5BC5BA
MKSKRVNGKWMDSLAHLFSKWHVSLPSLTILCFLFTIFPSIASSESSKLLHQYQRDTKDLTTQDCVSCHKDQEQKWHLSDHFMAMAIPSNSSVKGDFNNQYVEHFNQKAHMFRQDEQYMVTVFDGAAIDEQSTPASGETFAVKYTFGHFPLQQYLVETQQGRLQVLPFAWDSRTEEEGGQRWYHNYTEEITVNDRLHWRQPLQNWNGMCADCHSDQLNRNYNLAKNTFNTDFSAINVGCVSCHGVMNKHVVDGKYSGDAKKLHKQVGGRWSLIENAKTAIWAGEPRDNTFMDTCFACHSLRSPLTDGFSADVLFLDQFSPSLVTDPLYFADGQIKEEVYVYGSFLQSKMYSKGVNCLDCHDPHTMKLKLEGNGVCLQCHKASEFDVPSHHRHTPLSSGSKCVNCHMPNATFMGVDERRDHSFKIPRPHVSDSFNTPNACLSCHSEDSNEWAKAKVEDWFDSARPLKINEESLFKLRHKQDITYQSHINIINDESIDVISRASALEMMLRIGRRIEPSDMRKFINSEHDLIRLAAARIGELLDPQARGELLSPLLRDELKSIRVATAQALVGIPLDQTQLPLFASAFSELMVSNKVSAWRGEGRLNIGRDALKENNLIGAELAFKNAIDVDPYFTPAYVNLADLYRAKQREDLVASVLQQGINKSPKSADMFYSYGLHLVRTKQLEKAIVEFKNALELDKSNQQMAYTYVLALDSKDSLLALNTLKELIGNYERTDSLKELGLYLAQKNNDREAFKYFQAY